MDEYDKQYPMGEEGMYDYYYDDKYPGAGEESMGDEEFDSDDALFFDNNDLANRIWEDNDWIKLTINFYHYTKSFFYY